MTQRTYTRTPTPTPAKCEECGRDFVYQRVTNERRFCFACVKDKRTMTKAKSIALAATRRRLIPYAGAEYGQRPDWSGGRGARGGKS